MSSWAVPGAKVVCIKRGDWVVVVKGVSYDTVKPVYGEICTIEEVDGENLVLRGYGEFYRISRFRPLTKSTKTQEEDIAMFWDILALTEITKEKEAHHGR